MNLRDEIEEILHPEKKELHPPPPQSIVGGESVSRRAHNEGSDLQEPYKDSADSTLAIDFNSIAQSSDFQRFIIYLAKKITPDIFRGVSTRVSNVRMVEQFNEKKADYRLVVKELKEVLRKRNNAE